MLPAEISAEIERLFDENPGRYTDAHLRVFQRFKDALNAGEIRAAERRARTHRPPAEIETADGDGGRGVEVGEAARVGRCGR